MRRKSLLTAVFFVLAIPSFTAAEQARPANESPQSLAMDLPASGWIARPLSENSVASVGVDKSSPTISGPIATLRLCAKAAGDVIGELSQFVDATPYRGKIILLRARISATSNTANLSDVVALRIGAHGKSGTLYPWMRTRVRATGQWIDVNEPLAVPDDADRLEIKLRQLQPGIGRIAGVSLTTTDAKSVGWEPPKPLSASGLVNLHAFARLLGYVRFFHPSDQAAAANWDDVAIAGVQRVENAPDSATLAQALRELFLPLAPTLRIYSTGGAVPATPDALLGAPNADFIGWVHHGVFLGEQSVKSLYFDKRIAVKNPEPKDVFAADLGGGVSIRMPTTLYEDTEGTLPHIKSQSVLPEKPTLFVPSGMDRTTRLADIILSWNVFQNFYPDFEVVPADWPSALDPLLKKAAIDHNETDFLDTLYEEVGGLHDGHADVFNLRQDLLVIPLLWDWIDGKLVVLRVGTGVKKLRAGDVIDRIDHRPVADVIAGWMRRISAATPQGGKIKLLQRLLVPPSSAVVTLDAHDPDGNEVSEDVVPGEDTVDWNQFDSLAPVAQLKPHIWYVDLRRIRATDLNASLASLATARVIVADVRGYATQDALSFIAHLSRKPIATGQFGRPVATVPDRLNVTYDDVGWHLPPQAPTFSGTFIFLANAWAVSRSETILGMVADNHLGLIVGSTTDGTDGDRNSVTVPGDYVLYWTGLRVRNLDGSRFFGVGITPNLPAVPTVAGIATGRDEVLEKAVAVAEHEARLPEEKH